MRARAERIQPNWKIVIDQISIRQILISKRWSSQFSTAKFTMLYFIVFNRYGAVVPQLLYLNERR
jgi:hypothetical protein